MSQPFKIKHSEEFGDYAVAKQIYEEGEIILTEEPILASPEDNKLMNDRYDFCCVGCFKILPEVNFSCEACGWPVCCEGCSQDNSHKSLECALFAQKKLLPDKMYLYSLKYLRAILLKNVVPDKYEKINGLASDYGDKWSEVQESVFKSAHEVLEFLNGICGFEVSHDEIVRLWSALKINSFSINWEEEADVPIHCGTAVFEVCSKLVHSCSPTVDWGIMKVVNDGKITWKIQLVARTKINKGDIPSIAYSSEGLNFGTGYRRTVFQRAFPFYCLCSRCMDPTEGDTFFSSPKCPTCKRGNMLPDDPLNSFTCWWTCNISTCLFVQEGEEIDVEIDRAEHRVLTLAESTAPESVDQLDQFIEDNSGKLLNENHFLVYHGTISWLKKGSFTQVLLEDTEKSTRLYEKILERASRCLRLSRRFEIPQEIVTLEMLVADTVAIYGFKSVNCRTIPAANADFRKSERFSKIIAQHVAEARKWVRLLPNYQYLEHQKTEIEELSTKWNNYAEDLTEKIQLIDGIVEDVGFSLMRLMFH